MIYITGDLHGYWDKRETFIRGLSENDILIVLGDFGWNWTPDNLRLYKVRCTTLFVDGNHENFDVLNNLPTEQMFGGTVGVLKDRVYHLKRGEMYTIKGKKFFCFGGALSIDKDYRIPGKSWWREEQPSREEFNHALATLDNNNWTFDYLITHTGSDEEIKEMFGHKLLIKDYTQGMISELINNIKSNKGTFATHFFGHMHKFIQKFGDDFDTVCMYEQILALDTKEFVIR